MTWRLADLEDAAFFQRLLEQGTPWLTALDGCAQDPIHHGEGDVLVHPGRVCKALVGLPGYRQADQQEKQILAWAALLHDIAKPHCVTVDPDGRIGSAGHAFKGSLQARRILWELDCPFALREQIVGLVAHHMAPPRIFRREDPIREVRRISQDCRCDLLALLAQADALGRICSDQAELLDQVALFAELAREAKAWDSPAAFASPAARYLYFQGRWHVPEQAPFEDFRCRVVVLSGLPGAGKDTWIARHYSDWPVVSLDDLRRSLGVKPTAPQAGVVEAAREIARGYLREGRDFVWNATNLSRQVRAKCLSLLLDYGAFVTIVYRERPHRIVLEQNRLRDAAVPESVMQRLLRKWELPGPTEAHVVEFQVGQAI